MLLRLEQPRICGAFVPVEEIGAFEYYGPQAWTAFDAEGVLGALGMRGGIAAMAAVHPDNLTPRQAEQLDGEVERLTRPASPVKLLAVAALGRLGIAPVSDASQENRYARRRYGGFGCPIEYCVDTEIVPNRLSAMLE